ncbi:gluconolactonase [Dictyobacter sp. S3.2.2.5]|uniref:Gluconolactonase n=1 Tax=Dictyobacter halimunensis TaxID=3026934 RepID=A0ABQ6FY75_9CHLR|nr:gluconolactonase [Dictyobacter sp. S3.2.2.5]
MLQAEHFLTMTNQLGEGSFWNADQQKLYWLDIKQKRFFRMDTRTKQYETFNVGAQIGVMAPRSGGGQVMATDEGLACWDDRAEELTIVANPLQGQANRRFNDGNIDIKGRFWAGSMCDPPDTCPTPQCALYRLDPDGSLHMMDEGLGMPNGLVWSPDNRILYLTDSPQQVIYAYDFDPETGAIEHRRPFVQTHGEPGVPDGLTIDSEGFLWSVRYNGWKIIRYDPSGKIEREVSVPVPHPTSCAFGGKDMNELYITTAWNELNAEQRRQSPQSGDLFYLQTDIKGVARRPFAG